MAELKNIKYGKPVAAVKQNGVATNNTHRHKPKEGAEAEAEDIKHLKTTKAPRGPRHLEVEVIEADEEARANVRTHKQELKPAREPERTREPERKSV